MRHWLFATTLAFAAAQAHAATPPADPRLATVVPDWMHAAHIPGAAIAHVRHGRIASIDVFGERAPGTPLTADAQFNVASLTKPTFAVMALHLVAERKLGLDSPLAEHWVDPDIADDPRRLALTPRLTLSHQSGLPNWREGKLAFLFAPGERHEYSGEGYEYTRHALEHLTGQPLRELMRTRVLAPAGMTATHYGWDPAIAGHEVTGYDKAGQPRDMKDLATHEPNAAAYMFTTIGDYARFAAWVARGAGLPKALQAEMARPQARHADPAEYFGLGWRVVRFDGKTVLSHDGREPGLRTQVFVEPASGDAVVIFTNSDHGELLVTPVVEAVLGDGEALMRQVAIDTWHYLRSLPAEQLEPMAQGISRNPSFMAKLLYAVDATLVDGAGLAAGERAQAHRAIDPFVRGMVAGTVDAGQAKAVILQLVEAGADGARLRDRFDVAQAAAWSKALQALPPVASASTLH
jgi:CubicO group peptidase (beta-lactamase class C family)